MSKNFFALNIEKVLLNDMKLRPLFSEREIWFASLGTNIGFEQDGGNGFLRPVLVFKKFNNDICLGIPITKGFRTGKYYFPIQVREKQNSLLLSQIRLLDTKRFNYKIDTLPKEEFERVKQTLTQLLG